MVIHQKKEPGNRAVNRLAKACQVLITRIERRAAKIDVRGNDRILAAVSPNQIAMSANQVRRHAARAKRVAQPRIDRLPGGLGQMIENDAATENPPLLLHRGQSPLLFSGRA
ncbi:hypothetical protein [Burkholderia thailandensis]|uniref:hypothetical protein n=1 Tax=Burkholderia thailandensis TaxID=57975 RepID=UPI001CBC5398|nr:hypothetical protein [Burkholderia thailandensis]MCS3395953.1 hypothetical protein [Burkholderia thailandensis]MCS6468582.1 hypothetical protein [Burkholderia thailandensis]MCS6474907.1 hypothetical protein [Burkholderia thailandensis]MCS6492834.1 hypothetical protein [Burkholderia thailandensis]MCS6499889.1 hypothetical protein [Burkholderia thailandensis]